MSRKKSHNSSAEAAAAAEFDAWLARYEPVEREIMEARERRLANAARRRSERARAFGDLCEATEGQAVAWRRKGLLERDNLVREGLAQEELARDSIAREGLSRDSIAREGLSREAPRCEDFVRECMVELAEGDVWTLLCLARYFRLASTRRIDQLRHVAKRPLYYAAENARRRALAVERRAISRRRTANPCPTREMVLEAWTHRRDSHEAAVRFGSMIEDLECYLDNSLRFDGDGSICGRNGGIKRWLQTEIPALYMRYTTVMRYKAMARKLRQIVGLADPVSAAVVVEGGRDYAAAMVEKRRDYSMAVVVEGRRDCTAADEKRDYVADEVAVLRAKAIWREVVAGVRGSATALMDRIDALLDPERVEEANMLAEWRRKYENEITLRTKSQWWKKLAQRTG